MTNVTTASVNNLYSSNTHNSKDTVTGGILTLPNGKTAYRYHYKVGTKVRAERAGGQALTIEHCYSDGGVLLSNGDFYSKLIKTDSGVLVATDSK